MILSLPELQKINLEKFGNTFLRFFEKLTQCTFGKDVFEIFFLT
jgi:hypothetical protein